ncbi:coiled-coil domain-containing protein [Mangrovibacterium diazotrophicum]|uniref:Uncharacterized protein n=1 Tax=Mangrovibacterium diazotrophicum TaxID=1261403 RepID=A0A419VWE0_9BACT|nr:hypothetical protein [Mangrovibacterium diazotrophicum]RKD86465.1 hypothetical protein BC643_4158 [Mangrovibacterium diazotrophicum]
MKKTLLFLFIVFGINAFGQERLTLKVDYELGGEPPKQWTTVQGYTPTCYQFLNLDVAVKRGYNYSKDKPQVMYRLTIKNNAPTAMWISLRWSFEGSGGAKTVESGQSVSFESLQTLESHPSFELYNMRLKFSQADRDRYGVYAESNILKCGDTFQSILNEAKAKKEKNLKIAALRAEINSLGDNWEGLVQKKSAYESLNKLEGNNKYSSQISKIDEQLAELKKKETAKNAKIKSLKTEIAQLPNTSEGLTKKKNLYQELSKVDEANNYSNELSQVDEQLAKLQSAADKEQGTKTVSSTANNSSSDNNALGSDSGSSSKSTTNSSTRQTNSSISGTTAAKSESSSSGQSGSTTSASQQKSAQELEQARRQAAYDAQMAKVKQQEAQMEQTSKQIAKFSNTYAPAVVEGVQSGVITHFGGTLDLYSSESEADSESTMFMLYGVGLGIADAVNWDLAFGKLDEGFSEEMQSSFAWSTGLDVKVFKGLQAEPGKYWFKVYLGGEVGGYSSEYIVENWKNEITYNNDGFFYGGRATAVLFNLFMVRYAIGVENKTVSSYDSSVEDQEFELDYSKLGFGLLIHF